MWKVTLWLPILCVACFASAAPPVTPGSSEEDLLKPPKEESPFDNQKKADADSLVFAKFYKWKRVTPKLETAAGEGAAVCSPTPGTTAGLADPDRFFHVFADKKAVLAYARPTGTPFPEGAMVVKELFPTAKKGAESRTLLALVKRDEGYDPKHDDWEFLVLRGSKKPIIVERGKIAHCQACHEKAKAQDFVFRSYAPGRR